MSVADTSIEAFETKAPDLHGEKLLVYDVIKAHGPMNNRQIQEHLTGQLEMSSVSARVNSLAEQGWIVMAYKALSSTGRKVQFWMTKSAMRQSDLFGQPEQECEG